MSKMSQLHSILSEQAYEMGYITLDQALADGWEVDYGNEKLVKPVDFQEQAHDFWLRERKEVLEELDNLIKAYDGATGITSVAKRARDFISKGEI